MSRIVIGVAGGIAAYKSCFLVRLWREAGHDVTVVPTENALRFVGLPTWEALSGNPVPRGLFARADLVPHVKIGQTADLVIIAPATADIIARAAQGIANDLLTNLLLTAHCPVVFVPGMHTEMWENPATQENLTKLRAHGAIVMHPASGRLTGKDTGVGRLPEPHDIFAATLPLLDSKISARVQAQDLAGQKILVSAGGTREAIDPVRYLGNNSSGKMGIAIARAAALRGAQVKLICANISVDVPSNCQIESVMTTAELGEAVLSASLEQDAVIMAAAPADYRAKEMASGKIKKTGEELNLALTETQDILAALVQQRKAYGRVQTLVGFAAETASSTGVDLVELGKAKLARKGCDFLVLNDVSKGAVFGAEENSIKIISEAGLVARAAGPKNIVAHEILNLLAG